DTVYRNMHVHGIVHDENACAMGGVAGHAGLFSSARDLAIFAQMMLNGGEYGGVRLLSPETIARWTARQGPRSRRALGWDTPSPGSSAGRYFSPRSFGHTGFTGTSIWIDPERGLFVILLTNRVNPTRQNMRHEPLRRAVADAVQAAVLDAPLIEWRPAGRERARRRRARSGVEEHRSRALGPAVRRGPRGDRRRIHALGHGADHVADRGGAREPLQMAGAGRVRGRRVPHPGERAGVERGDVGEQREPQSHGADQRGILHCEAYGRAALSGVRICLRRERVGGDDDAGQPPRDEALRHRVRVQPRRAHRLEGRLGSTADAEVRGLEEAQARVEERGFEPADRGRRGHERQARLRPELVAAPALARDDVDVRGGTALPLPEARQLAEREAV